MIFLRWLLVGAAVLPAFGQPTALGGGRYSTFDDVEEW